MYYINILTSGWLEQLIFGALLTIMLTAIAFSFGMLIALFFTASSLFNNKAINYVANIYTVIFRGLPELLVIFFFFYLFSDIASYISKILQIGVNSSILKFIVAVIALALIEGCYLTEVLRGGLSSVEKGQIEAGLALGMHKSNILIRIVFPQVVAYSWSGISNIWLLCLKDSSLVMVIGLTELMFKSNLAVTTTGEPFLFYGIAGIIYLFMAIVSNFMFKKFTPGKKYSLMKD